MKNKPYKVGPWRERVRSRYMGYRLGPTGEGIACSASKLPWGRGSTVEIWNQHTRHRRINSIIKPNQVLLVWESAPAFCSRLLTPCFKLICLNGIPQWRPLLRHSKAPKLFSFPTTPRLFLPHFQFPLP